MSSFAPRCSVVIPAYGNSKLTRACLASLLKWLPPFDVQIIVVDDASPDDTLQVLESFGDRIEIVRRSKNGGYSRACNAGLAVARGDYVVFLNNDTLSQEPWLETMVAYAEAHPSAGLVGCRLIYRTSKIQHAGVAFDANRQPFHIYRQQPMGAPWVSRNRVMQAVTGAVSLIPRGIIERIGGYDEGFLNSYEDIDLCLAVRDLGQEVHYCADAIVTHLETQTRTSMNSTEQANAERLSRRWKSVLRSDVLSILEADGLVSANEHYPGKVRIEFNTRVVLAKRQADPSE